MVVALKAIDKGDLVPNLTIEALDPVAWFDDLCAECHPCSAGSIDKCRRRIARHQVHP
jgi:hypothetical protein